MQQSQQHPYPIDFQQTVRNSPLPGRFNYPTPNNFNQIGDTQLIKQHTEAESAENFDESAFEAAFAEARAEIETQESGLQKEDDGIQPEAVDSVRIGSDTISPEVDSVDDSDALAETAGQLLSSVSHDQSQKFKESNFLSLMRQIRDREVTVQGDELRQVSTLS